MGKVIKLQICQKKQHHENSDPQKRQKSSLTSLKDKRRSNYAQVESIDCIQGVGITGDDNAKGDDRQVTLMDEAVNQWIASQPEKGLCSGRFKGNITIEGLDTSLLQQGSLLTIGGVKLEISSVSKKCYSDWCKLYSKESACPIPLGCYFAKVVQSGRIQLGDACMAKEFDIVKTSSDLDSQIETEPH